MVKGVSKIQELVHEGQYLQYERLWEVLKYAVKYPEDKIAQLFIHHSQFTVSIHD